MLPKLREDTPPVGVPLRLSAVDMLGREDRKGKQGQRHSKQDAWQLQEEIDWLLHHSRPRFVFSGTPGQKE